MRKSVLRTTMASPESGHEHVRVELFGIRYPVRRGISLAEMLVVIALLGGMAVVATQTMMLFMGADTAVANDAALLLNLERLEDRFRQDVHAASRAEVADEPARQTLRLSGEERDEIRYISEENRIIRETVINGQRATDRFVFSGRHCRFQVDGPSVQFTVTDDENHSLGPSDQSFPTTLGKRQRVWARLDWTSPAMTGRTASRDEKGSLAP